LKQDDLIESKTRVKSVISNLGNKLESINANQVVVEEEVEDPNVVKIGQQVRVTWHNIIMFKLMFPRLVS